MRASTLWQPWASLVAVGAKPFETRNYPPPAKLIGQRIAIHAAVRPIQRVWRELDWQTREAILDALQSSGFSGDLLGKLPHGAVVCTAVLAGAGKVKGIDDGITRFEPGWIKLMSSMGNMPSMIKEDRFGFYGPGRWAWLLKDVQRLDPPVPAKGMQGFWTWEPPHA